LNNGFSIAAFYIIATYLITLPSLINQRCKGQQHMRWSREGLNPVLQLRASIFSNDWSNKWQTAVLNAA
jgi:hypothetical protein